MWEILASVTYSLNINGEIEGGGVEMGRNACLVSEGKKAKLSKNKWPVFSCRLVITRMDRWQQIITVVLILNMKERDGLIDPGQAS